MKSFFKVDRYYIAQLSKSQIVDKLNDLTTQKEFGGLRVDRFVLTISENGFLIQRNTSGVDFFTLERYPAIEGIYFSDNPIIINILIRPNYLMIAFFALFVFVFIPTSLFIDEMTINGVLKAPTIFERFLFAGIGGILPGLWGYFGYVRPIKKAETWVVEKLNLTPTDYYGS
jgi:hypothetical protein